MNRLPRSIRNLIDHLQRLPGVGPKTAARLAFYLLNFPQAYLANFAQAIVDLKQKTKRCSICHGIDEKNPCQICSDPKRDKKIVCVVERALDILAIEKTGRYSGVYHVLGGAINPLEQIGPDNLTIKELLERIKEGFIREVIVATNPTMEGEATAMFLKSEVAKITKGNGFKEEIKVTRIGHGLPIGADLEYADELTLTKSLEGRQNF